MDFLSSVIQASRDIVSDVPEDQRASCGVRIVFGVLTIGLVGYIVTRHYDLKLAELRMNDRTVATSTTQLLESTNAA